jgi:hypothetical protein
MRPIDCGKGRGERMDRHARVGIDSGIQMNPKQRARIKEK